MMNSVHSLSNLFPAVGSESPWHGRINSCSNPLFKVTTALVFCPTCVLLSFAGKAASINSATLA